MGKALTYEIGRLNIGRWVRCTGCPGISQEQRGKLVTANPKNALIKLMNRDAVTEIPWKHISDWTSKNNGVPLVMPPETPADARIRENGKAQPMTPVKHAVPMPPLNMGDLGGKIREAVADVASAKAMLDEAESRLRGLRNDAVAQLNSIDQTIRAAGLSV